MAAIHGATPRRPRILFVAEAVSLAHIGRPLSLALIAREAGYDVHLAGNGELERFAAAEGLPFHKIETITSNTFYERLTRGVFFYREEELEGYLRSEKELLARLRPDWVVGEFRLSLGISCRQAGVRLLALANAYWSPASVCRFEPPAQGLLGALPDGLRRSLFNLLRPLAFRTWAAPLNRVRRRHGLPALRDFREYYTEGDACAYLDLPELVPLRQLPAGHRFLGPVAWRPQQAPQLKPPAAWRPETGRPLVYVSSGSTADQGAWEEVFAILAEKECALAVTGINPDQEAGLLARMPSWRGRLSALPLADPSRVLAQAALTVCHGGSGTVYQSLAAGVPVLCLPANPDQGLVGQAIEAAQAGRSLSPRAPRSQLREALEALLSDGPLRVAARGLAARLAAHDTPRRWRDLLATLAGPAAGDVTEAEAVAEVGQAQLPQIVRSR